MKHLLIRLLVAIVPLFPALAQRTVTVQLPADLAEKAWVKAYVDSVAKAGGTVKPVEPVPATSPCTAGPQITEISGQSNTGLKVRFHGQNVFKVSIEVFDAAGNAVFSDTISPRSSLLDVPFKGKTLTPGSYTLKLKGRSCTGQDTRPFTIAGPTGHVPDPVNPAPGLGELVAKKAFSGLKENMNIYVTRNPAGGWFLHDSSTTKPQDGTEFWYGINNYRIKQSTPLKNYPWPAATPLQVWKAQPRLGLDMLLRWSETVDLFDPNAAKPFSFNDSYPHAIFYFQKADSAFNERKQVASWMDWMPDMQLPPGQVWVMPIGNDDPELLLRKGVTHFSKYQVTGKPYEGQLVSAGRVYDEVPKTPEQFNLTNGTGRSKWVPGKWVTKAGGFQEWQADPWPGIWNEMFFGPYREGQREPLTYEEGKQAGRRYQVQMPVVVFENFENNHAVGSQWPFIRGFYETYIPRMEAEWLAKGIQPLVAHNYFTSFGGVDNPLTLGNLGRQANKDILRKPLSQWPASQLLPGGTLEKTTAVCYGYYLKSPDATRDEAYKFIFGAKVARLAGKGLLLFPQAFHEDKPNNYVEVRYPDGTFYLRTKQKHNPAELATISFLAQAFGSGTIPFGAAGRTDENFRFLREFHGKEGNVWRPKGAPWYTTSDDGFPYYVDNGGETFPAGTFEYGLAEGVRLYCQTFAKVRGGAASFLEYRIDGGSWVKPANNDLDDLVDAYYDKKPIVYSETKNGLAAVFFLHPYADTSLHKLEYRLNGKVYTMDVHSVIIHPVLHAL